MGTSDDQPVDKQTLDLEGNLTILDFLTTMEDNDSNAFGESYKYPDDKLEADIPLDVENINEGVPDSELQRITTKAVMMLTMMLNLLIIMTIIMFQ